MLEGQGAYAPKLRAARAAGCRDSELRRASRELSQGSFLQVCFDVVRWNAIREKNSLNFFNNSLGITSPKARPMRKGSK